MIAQVNSGKTAIGNETVGDLVDEFSTRQVARPLVDYLRKYNSIADVVRPELANIKLAKRRFGHFQGDRAIVTTRGAGHRPLEVVGQTSTTPRRIALQSKGRCSGSIRRVTKKKCGSRPLRAPGPVSAPLRACRNGCP